MARSRVPFDEFDDNESVATDTTVGSVQEESYTVEKILLEKDPVAADANEFYYLLKWQGYPLYEASWEPASHLESDELLVQWENQKRLIARGGAQPFDENVFNAAVKAQAAKQRARQSKRRQKRRARGIAVSPTPSPEESESEVDSGEVTPSPKRRRLAVKKRNVDSNDDEDMDDDGTSAPLSMDDTVCSNKPSSRKKRLPYDSDKNGEEGPPSRSSPLFVREESSVSQQSIVQPATAETTTPTSETAAASQTPAAGLASTQPTATQPTTTQTLAAARKPAGSTAIRTTAGRKSAPNIFVPKPGARKPSVIQKQTPSVSEQRPPISGQIAKDSTGPQYKSIGHRYRAQRKGQNEPAPDISQLNFDWNKSKTQASAESITPITPSGPTATGPKPVSAISSVYGRRSPQPERKRSPSPVSAVSERPSGPNVTGPKPVSAISSVYGRRSPQPERKRSLSSAVPVSERAPVAIMRPVPDVDECSTSSMDRTERRGSQKSLTCPFWKKGHCRYSADECNRAHYETGSGKLYTCFYWNEDSCRFREEDCIYAHRQTGLIAPPPGKKYNESLDRPLQERSASMHELSSMARRQSFTGEAAPLADPSLHEKRTNTPDTSTRTKLDLTDGRLPSTVFSPSFPVPKHQTTCWYWAHDGCRKGQDSCEFAHRETGTMAGPPYTFGRKMPQPVRSSTMPIMKRAHDDGSLSHVEAMPPPSTSPAQTTIRAIEHLFSLDGDKCSEELDQAIFLFIPQGYDDVETEATISHWKAKRLKVYHSNQPDSWKWFRQRYRNCCLVVIHPALELWDIDGLHEFLTRSGLGVRLFRCGIDVAEPEGFLYQRLFPHGTVTLITDDVFAYHPDKATQIVNDFMKAHRPKKDGGEHNRLVARPGLKQWLLKLIQEAPSKDLVALYTAVCDLCPPEDEDLEGNPLESSVLVSGRTEDFPDYAELWDRDHGRATDVLVEWFASWTAIHNATEYRRIFVSHDGPVPVHWARFKHLGVINA